MDEYFEKIDILNRRFEALREHMIDFGLPYEEFFKSPRRSIIPFNQVKAWNQQYGYKFNIHGNDHFIEGKKHFHFDSKNKEVQCKLDFDGNILESKGDPLDSKVHKVLLKFLSSQTNRNNLNSMWDYLNPHLDNTYQ